MADPLFFSHDAQKGYARRSSEEQHMAYAKESEVELPRQDIGSSARQTELFQSRPLARYVSRLLPVVRKALAHVVCEWEATMDEQNRLTKTKEQWAKARRGGEEREVFYEGDARLPPGQHLVETFPVLDLGFKPEVPLSEWSLTIGGFVTTPVTWTWEQFLAQPQFKDLSDFHCVTSWSRFDNEWEGVSFKHILSVVKPLSSAKFVLFKSFDDYTTNLPLEACDDQDVLLTYKWNGKPLTKEHGGPVRVIVPKRYAWKGAKWVKEITFSDRDEKGFWEVRGYSNSAFPWENDRYG